MWRLWRIFTTSASLSEMRIILFLYFACYMERFIRLLDHFVSDVLSKFDIFKNLGPREEELLDPAQVEEIIANHRESASSSSSVIRARQVTRLGLDSSRAPENVLTRDFPHEGFDDETAKAFILLYVLIFHFTLLDDCYRLMFKKHGEEHRITRSFIEYFTTVLLIGPILIFGYMYWRRKLVFELDESVSEAYGREVVLRSVLLLPHFKFYMTRHLKSFRYYLIILSAMYLKYWAVRLNYWQNHSSFCELLAEPAESIGIVAVYVGAGYLVYYMFDMRFAFLFSGPPHYAFVK